MSRTLSSMKNLNSLSLAILLATAPALSFADATYDPAVPAAADKWSESDQTPNSKRSHFGQKKRGSDQSFLTKEGEGDQPPAPTSAAAPMMPFADTRLVLFSYDPDLTYGIKGKEGLYTHIEIAQGDTIKGFYLSDTLKWKYHISADKRRLFIKPTMPSQFTAATMVTDKRVYEITLSSVKGIGDWYQRVTWSYPPDPNTPSDPLIGDASGIYEDTSAADISSKTNVASGVAVPRAGPQFEEESPVGTVDPTKMSFGYTVTGSAEFRPVTVFDDGRFTWLRFDKKMQDMPAIFLLNSSGKAEVLPYTTHGDYILISRLINGVLLRLGNEEVKITKEAKRCGIFGC